ncbi:UNVERIFIED_CONTAM: hypothetical protein RMT77_018767 [Armadillidium vulgare]
MKLFYYCIIFILTITILPLVKGGNILFFTLGSKSHKIFFMSIAEALAKRSHNVTIVSPYEPSKKIENIREILIANFSMDSLLDKAFTGGSTILPLLTEIPKICVQGLGQKKVQDLKKEKFDLIILNVFFMDYCFLSFVHYFKIPFIYAHAGALTNPYYDTIGSFNVPAISGNIYVMPEFPLTFKQRLKTTVLNSLFYVLSSHILEPRMYFECVKSGFCPLDMPSFAEIHKNASLMIVNSVKTLEWPPKPGMPNVIHAGGAHIKAPKKLAQDLEDWVEGSEEEGFILFSLGSALNPDFFPEEYRQILVKVFGSLKQRVLWKWNNETMPDLPKNVKLRKWLPQPDLLGHPKIRLFITHGGQLSTLEALYNGVPVIGIPVFSDQHTNMKIIESEGWGRVLELKKLDEHAFRILIQETLNNKTIIEIAKSKSSIMQDRLIPPDEEAAYWVEYVMRHKGAPHIMSPLNSMSLYQIYNIDVWALLLFTVVGSWCLSFIIILYVCKECLEIRKYKANKNKKD